MVYLYGIKIPEEIDIHEYEYLLQCVSKERQLSIDKFRFDQDKKRSMFAELLLRYLLDNCLSIKDKNLSFTRNSYGKPELKDYKNIHFNCSHSGNWVLCAAGDSPIGVDIEMMKAGDLDIAKRFFSCGEYTWLQELTGKERNKSFYQLWTLKESYVKALGMGLSIPLNSFSFKLEDKIELKTDQANTVDYSFWSQQIDEEHMASLCFCSLMEAPEYVEFKTVTYDMILGWLRRSISGHGVQVS